jgi:hypothetical protein
MCQELERAFSGVTVATKLELLTSPFKAPNPFPSNFEIINDVKFRIAVF